MPISLGQADDLSHKGSIEEVVEQDDVVPNDARRSMLTDNKNIQPISHENNRDKNCQAPQQCHTKHHKDKFIYRGLLFETVLPSPSEGR